MTLLRNRAKSLGSIWNDDLPPKIENSITSAKRRPRAIQATDSEWKLFRALNDATGDQSLGCRFPKLMGGVDFEEFAIDLVEKPARLRVMLMHKGAALSGTIKEQIEFVTCLCATLPEQPIKITSKPGFKDKSGFVLGTRNVGTAKGTYQYLPMPDVAGSQTIGARAGSLEAWQAGPGNLALTSSYLTFAICLALAAPIPGYLYDRKTGKIVSESATFYFVGTSGTGKTSLNNLALSAFSKPDEFASWQFTRRGFENIAESRNNLLLVFDDTETCVEDGIDIKTAIRHVTQLVAFGRAKNISSAVAREKGFRQSTWSTFALTGGPHLSDVYFKDSKTARTPGERVRFIDIPVPALAKGGIFDRAEDRDQRPHELAEELEDGVAQNYGHLFPAWLKVLLNSDQSEVLHSHSRHFLRKVLTPASTAYDRRFAKKFALVYAVGRIAVNAGLLPWPNDWPMRAVSRCYYRAYATLHAPDEMTDKTIAALSRLADDQAAFKVVTVGNTKRVTLTPDMIGVRARYKNQDVLGVRDKALRRLCCSKSAAERVIAKLKLHGAIVGGHGHAGTTQLPITLYADGSRYSKPRFWLIAPDRLKTVLRPRP